MSPLGRIVDRDAMEAEAGPRALARITVPAAWAEAACLVEVTVPRVLACAACEGGGCDGCDRSGALRGPAKEAARRLRFRLPGALGSGVRVRIAAPFGRSHAVTQIWIEVRPGAAPSAGALRVSSGRPQVRRSIVARMVPAMFLLVAVIGAGLALFTWLGR